VLSARTAPATHVVTPNWLENWLLPMFMPTFLVDAAVRDEEGGGDRGGRRVRARVLPPCLLDPALSLSPFSAHRWPPSLVWRACCPGWRRRARRARARRASEGGGEEGERALLWHLAPTTERLGREGGVWVVGPRRSSGARPAARTLSRPPPPPAAHHARRSHARGRPGLAGAGGRAVGVPHVSRRGARPAGVACERRGAG
jgi:hypothetical protein